MTAQPMLPVPDSSAYSAQPLSEHYRLMVEAAGVVMFATDPYGTLTYVNPAVEPVLGFTQADVLGRHSSEFVVPESRQTVADFYRDQFYNRVEKTVIEYPLLQKTGETRWVEQTVVLLTEGTRVSGFLGYVRDIHDRKMAEAALEQERHLLRTLIDLLPDYIFIKDRDGRFITVNQASVGNSGFATMDEMLGRTDFDIFPPEFAETYRRDDERLLATGEPIIHEEASVSPLGEPRWLYTSKVPLRDANGNITGIVGMAHDITRQKAYEAELQAARNELEARVAERTADLAAERNLLLTLIDHLPDYIYVKDTNCRFLVGNASVADVMHTTRDELVGKTDFDFYAPELAAQYQADDMEVMRTGIPLVNHEEQNIDRFTGNARWILTTKVPLRDSAGRTTGLVGIGRDFTVRKDAEDAVRKQQEFLRKVIDTNPNVIFMKDTEGRYVLVNQAQAEAAGTTVDAMIGKTDDDYNSNAEIVATYHQEDEEVLATRQPKYIPEEAVMDQRTGETRYWQTIKVPILSDDGTAEYVLGVATDITERKRAEAQALQLAMERERIHMLANFIRDASHDFRTPLSTINTSLYLLAKTPDAGKQAMHREIIQQQTAHLAKLIDGLLTMTRLDSEPIFRRTPVNLNGVVETLLARSNLSTRGKLLHWNTTLQWDLPDVDGDAVELDRAVTELAKNAAYYTPDGGSVTIRTFRDAGNVVLEVQDTGIGIAESEQERIFARFYRVDKARSTETGGIGLGLSIAQKIAEVHGGIITVQSALGQGSTFRLMLPARAAAPAAASA